MKTLPTNYTKKETLHPIIRDNIMAGSTYTNGNPSYERAYRRHKVVNHSAKQYVNGIEDWLANWKRNNWRTTNKKAVKNQDLWMELDRLNELCNQMAMSQRT